MAVNPYSQFFDLKSLIPVSDSLLPSDLVAQIVEEFEGHPGLTLAQETPVSFTNSLNAVQISQGVKHCEDLIRHSGIFETPKGVHDFLATEPASSPNRVAFRFFSALASLRESLHVLNQMVYQSFLQDRISTLDSDSVIDIVREVRTLVGSAIEIAYQPNGDLMLLDPTDILLVTKIPNYISENLLCQAASLNNQFSRDFGFMNKIEMRILDRNLNPYNALLNNV